MRCTKCGAEALEDARFCGQCGQRLEQGAAEPAAATAEARTEARRAEARPARPMRSGARRTLALAVILVVAGGYAGYRLWWVPRQDEGSAPADEAMARAVEMERAGMYEAAIPAYLQAAPDNAEARLGAGRCCLLLDPPRVEKAREHFQSAILLDASYRAKANGLLDKVARDMLAQDRPQDAERAWRAAINPSAAYVTKAWDTVCARAWEIGRQEGVDGARRHLDAALRIAPDQRPALADACAGQAEAARTAGDMDLAREWIRQAGRLDPERFGNQERVMVLLEEAKRSRDAGDLDSAYRHLTTALNEDPECVLAHFMLAWLHWGRGESDAAIAEFEAVIALEPASDYAADAVKALEKLRAQQ